MKKHKRELNATTRTVSNQTDLDDFLRDLTQGSVVVAKDCLTLPEIREALAAGEIAEISIAAFWRPLLVDSEEWKQGKLFTYAAAGEPLGLYWQVGMYKHFCRPLTWEQTHNFRWLAKKSLAGTSTTRRPASSRKTCKRNSNLTDAARRRWLGQRLQRRN